MSSFLPPRHLFIGILFTGVWIMVLKERFASFSILSSCLKSILELVVLKALQHLDEIWSGVPGIRERTETCSTHLDGRHISSEIPEIFTYLGTQNVLQPV